jgi:Superfamily II helicase and inactivated derivatives
MSSRSQAKNISCELWSASDDSEVVNYYFRFSFRTPSGESKTYFLPRAAGDNIPQIRKNLLNLGAVSMPTQAGLSKLLDAADRAGRKGCLVHRPGWHGDAFLSFEGEGEINVGKEKLSCQHHPLGPDAYLGHQSGLLRSWQQHVATPALSSAIISYAIMCAFAAPLARHAGLTEGAIFCITGPSSTGKTTALKVAASVSGDPEKIGGFSLTRAGAEEFSYAHSDHLLLIDDTERNAGDITRLVNLATDVLTDGKGKARSKPVHDTLPAPNWFTFGLMASPHSLASVTQKQRTTEQQVRLIEIPVPDGDNGIFDSLESGETGTTISKALLTAIRKHHGSALIEWQDHLSGLSAEVEGGIKKLVESYMQKKGLSLSGADRRVLAKLLLPVWAAKKARDLRILPWTLEDISSVADDIILPALETLRAGSRDPTSAWQNLADAIADRNGFFDARNSKPLPRVLRTKPGRQYDIGVIANTDHGQEVGLSSAVVKHMQDQGDTALADAITEAPEQRRLPLKGGKTARPRLYWLSVRSFTKQVRDNAGEGYDDWAIDD